MAKILITFYQTLIDESKNNALICYYESLANELKNCGNEVLFLNMAYLPTEKIKSCLKFATEKIKEFSPDVIFTFNNRITKEIIDVTNCPICLFEADCADFFVNAQLIKTNLDRYYLINFYNDYLLDKYLSLGFEKNKICTINQATSVKNEKLEKINNISFIGTKFESLNGGYFFPEIDKNKYFKLYSEYLKNNYKNYPKLEEFCLNFVDNELNAMYSMIDMRLAVLNSVSDLGLKLYGVGWNKLSNENLVLKSLFDKTLKYSLKHNQDVYNSSIINLSINHPQCRGIAFPWRCYDILASSGILISNYSKDLNEKTKKYLKIPMYHSPAEARELCLYALNNPNYVEDIVCASNEFIEKEGRWENNFKKIEDFIGVKLINNDNKKYEYKFIEFPNCKLKNKRGSKIGWGIWFILSEIYPIKYLLSKKHIFYVREKIGQMNNYDYQ